MTGEESWGESPRQWKALLCMQCDSLACGGSLQVFELGEETELCGSVTR